MPAQATWSLLPTASTQSVQVDDPNANAISSLVFLGSGLIRPFQRDGKSDFAHATGARLVQSAVGQILGTRASSAQQAGELPWRPEFGSLVHVLRHSNNDDELRHVAIGFVVDALARWEPRVKVTGFGIDRRRTNSDLDTLEITVRYDIIDRNVPGNNVILSGQQATVEFEVGAQ